MILAGDAEPVQIGAFFATLRYRKETADELAGFVLAAREFSRDRASLQADLDWPSYADRHRQLPYFLLAALLLAANGMRILVHGIAGEGPVSTPRCLAALGLRPAASAAEAAAGIDRHGIAYLPLGGDLPCIGRAVRIATAARTALAGEYLCPRTEPGGGGLPDAGRVPSELHRPAPRCRPTAGSAASGDLQGRRRRSPAQPPETLPRRHARRRDSIGRGVAGDAARRAIWLAQRGPWIRRASSRSGVATPRTRLRPEPSSAPPRSPCASRAVRKPRTMPRPWRGICGLAGRNHSILLRPGSNLVRWYSVHSVLAR